MSNPTVNSDTLRTKIVNKYVMLAAIFFWLYVLIKVFVFDFDNYLLESIAPEQTYLMSYKFVGVVTILAAIFYFKKNIAYLWVIYIALFPLILFLWILPYYIFKQKSWVLAIACINTIITMIISLKHFLLILFIYVVCTLMIFKFENTYLITINILLICATFIYLLVKRITMIFKESMIHDVYKKIVMKPFNDNFFKQISLDKEIKQIPFHTLTDKQLSHWADKLQAVVLYNRLYIFMARKLKNYQESKLSYAFYAFSIISLVALIIVTFSIINYGLYRIDNSAFKLSEPSSFFTFFYYSFNTIVINGIDEVKPQSIFSKISFMSETLLSLILGLVFATLLFSARHEKSNQELDLIISKFEERGNELELIIKNEYNLESIDEALEKLKIMQSALLNIIYKITERL